LLSLPEAKAAGALMPREVLASRPAVPVNASGRCGFSNAPQREHETPDPSPWRRKALQRCANYLDAFVTGNRCLYVDDLQWSDADSTSLFEELLRPPDSPPLATPIEFSQRRRAH